MTTISVDIDEKVEDFIRRKDIPLHSYLWKLIQEDMLLEGIGSSKTSLFRQMNSVNELNR